MLENAGTEGAEHPARPGIFRWESLRVVEASFLPYEEPIFGSTVEIGLVSGSVVKCFRADDGKFHFCHGLTFGGVSAPGGAISPYSQGEVGKILNDLYEKIAEIRAMPGDILVWRDFNGDAIHSAVILLPVAVPGGKVLEYSTVMRSKNGIRLAADVPLQLLIDAPDGYGESYTIYRRK
jgi:hypothetical protein